MQITYQLTRKDFLDGFKASRNRNAFTRWAFRFGYVVAVAVIALALFAAIGVVATHDSRLLGNLIPLFVLAAFWFLLLWGAPSFSAQSQFKSSPTAQGPVSMTFSDEGLQYQTAFSSATLAWGAFVRAVDQKNIFALFTSSRMFIPVPKRAFTPEQLTEFRQLLQQKIQPM